MGSIYVDIRFANTIYDIRIAVQPCNSTHVNGRTGRSNRGTTIELCQVMPVRPFGAQEYAILVAPRESTGTPTLQTESSLSATHRVCDGATHIIFDVRPGKQ